MNEQKIFTSEQFGTVRTVVIGNEVWFIAKDVIEILKCKYKTSVVKNHVNEKDKGWATINFGNREHDCVIINKNGLHILVGFAKLTNAKKFEKWIVGESKLVVNASNDITKQNGLRIFENAEFGAIRSMVIDGEPWFVGKDVAEALGYERPTKAVSDHVDSEDIDAVPIQDSIGRMQKTPIINESALYALIFSSKLDSAKKFKRWVTSEVLPTIRKHGLYATDEVLANPDRAMAALKELREEREKNKLLEATVALQALEIEKLKPMNTYIGYVAICHGETANTGEIADDYGWKAKKLNKYLCERGIQMKVDGTWVLCDKYKNCGYTVTSPFYYRGWNGVFGENYHTYWTQAGIMFIYNLLKADGIHPRMEVRLQQLV